MDLVVVGLRKVKYVAFRQSSSKNTISLGVREVHSGRLGSSSLFVHLYFILLTSLLIITCHNTHNTPPITTCHIIYINTPHPETVFHTADEDSSMLSKCLVLASELH